MPICKQVHKWYEKMMSNVMDWNEIELAITAILTSELWILNLNYDITFSSPNLK